MTAENINPDDIPKELRARAQWVLWKYEERDGKKTKVPYQTNGYRASVSLESSWNSLSNVLQVYNTMGGYSGIAYVLAKKDPFVGIDMDDCIVDGDLSTEAGGIVKRLNSYAEISPSGEGIRLFIKAKKPGDRCRTAKHPGIEIYDGERLLSVTGDVLPGTGQAIEPRQDELAALYNEIFPQEEEHGSSCGKPGEAAADDSVLIEKALTSKRGDKFKLLYVLGDTSGHGGDHSAADMGLCNMLAFWTNKDAAVIDRIFRSSALMRPKWDEKRGRNTYGDMTIDEAIGGCGEGYQPPRAERITEHSFGLSDFCHQNDEKWKFSPSKTAAALTDKMVIAADKGGVLRWYDDEIYQDTTALKVADTIYTTAGDLVRKQGVGEVLDRVGANRRLYPTKFDPDPFLMPLQNGILELATGEFRSYEADDLATFKYGAEWDETADYKRLLWALCSSLPDPLDVLAAIDIMTATALRTPFNVVNLLIGGGANGKGIFEEVLLALFTQERSTALSMEELSKSRFGSGALFNMDLWIVSEVEGVKGAVNALKKIATGEFTDSDQKYGPRVKGQPHAMPIIDTNNAFDFGDDSYGRKRRINKLNFPYTFGYEPGQRPKEPHLKEMLTTPEALAGAVRLIVARAPELIESRQVFNRKTTEESEDEYKRQQYSLNYFCDECLECDHNQDARLTPKEVHGAYTEYCKRFNVPTPAKSPQLSKYIFKRLNVESKTSTDQDGKTYRYYSGLAVTKTPSEAFSDYALSNHHTNHSKTTVKTQKGIIETAISGYITTEKHSNHSKTMISIIEEIWKMYAYISSCESERDICYEQYLKSAVVSVVTVVSGHSIAVSAQWPCVFTVVEQDEPVVSDEKSDVPTTTKDQPNKIDLEVQEGDATAKEKTEHFEEVASKKAGTEGQPTEESEGVIEKSSHELNLIVPADENVTPTQNDEEVASIPHKTRLAFERKIRAAMTGDRTITVGDLSTRTGWEIDLCLNRLNILVEQRGWSKKNGTYTPPGEAI